MITIGTIRRSTSREARERADSHMNTQSRRQIRNRFQTDNERDR
jgi:hypothetical protein